MALKLCCVSPILVNSKYAHLHPGRIAVRGHHVRLGRPVSTLHVNISGELVFKLQSARTQTRAVSAYGLKIESRTPTFACLHVRLAAVRRVSGPCITHELIERMLRLNLQNQTPPKNNESPVIRV